MKSFRELITQNESPVGKVGRTKDSEAAAHIENSDLAKRFRKIVRELGGKNVARQLLSGMNSTGKKVDISEPQYIDDIELKEGFTSIEGFLRDIGYKIKEENPKIRKKELVFYKANDAQSALNDLQDEKLFKDVEFELKGTLLTYKL